MTGVVLLNMGGPDTLSAVRPFLANLFLDRAMFRLPMGLFAQPVFAWIVSGLRARKVRRYYEEIGGGSPIARLTEEQRAALETALRADGMDARVFTAMRYWHPNARHAALEMKEAGVDRVVLLPLYPQYFSATTGSSVDDFVKAMKWVGLYAPVTEIRSYPDHPGYVASLVEKISETLARAKAENAPAPLHLLFSAHGVPVSFIERGDPYLDEIRKTVAAAMASLPGIDHSISFQSRTGPVKWLEPDTVRQVETLGRKGVKTLLVVPVAFVSDHIETLHELDIRLKKTAEGAGINRFYRVPVQNGSPTFIRALRDLVRSAV